MKKNYNPKRLNKRQRHLKKWITDSYYCDNCPFWFNITEKVEHKRELCEYSKGCTDNCNKCDLTIAYCSFMNYIEYGEFPLGDGCKVCDIRDESSIKARRRYIRQLRYCMMPPMCEFIDKNYVHSKSIKKK